MKLGSYLILLGVCLLSGQTLAAVPTGEIDLSQFRWDNYGDDIVISHGRVEGSWRHDERWKGFLCNGRYQWTANVGGRIADVIIEYRPDNSLAVYGDIRDLQISLDGAYRGSKSACMTMALGHDISVDRAELKARVKVYDNPHGNRPNVQARILETSLGKVYYNFFLADWFQPLLTGSLNEALDMVWSTQLGVWISDVIVAQLGH